ncbi:MAG: HAD-IA family hydrolase [Chloroflexota bacterium]|nr:HAD-IA family hydrolase [Chloroflexota bacterium]
MPLRAVFLDIGDTIMRPDPSWEHVYEKAFAEYGLDVTAEQLRDALREVYQSGGYGFEGRFDATEETSYRRTVELDRRAMSALGVGPMPDEFFRRLAELFMVTSHWHVFPDVVPALRDLKARRLTLGVVSNWVWTLPELLHELELVAHFDFVVASSRIGYEKPHAGIFEHALHLAEVAAADVIHVGDNVRADVAGAQAAGIEPVLIDRRGRVDEPPDGVVVIRSLDELLPIVDARLAAVASS